MDISPFVDLVPPRHRLYPTLIARRDLEMQSYHPAAPGRLVSKEELLQSVWSGRVVGHDGIRGCVREIRAALGDLAKTPLYLQTVTGQGHRFLEGRYRRVFFPEATEVGAVAVARDL